MFYILSRIFAVIASPWFYILILFTLASFLKGKKMRKGCFIGAWTILLVFSNGMLYQVALNAWTADYLSMPDTTRSYKYALLPGGFSSYDTKRNRTEYGFAVDRLVDAVLFYKRGVVKKIVITGDGASCRDGNPKAFVRHLNEVWGVRPEDVIIEPNAKNTFQNIKLSLQAVKDMDSGNTLLINSAIYMKRTLQSCKQLNFHPAYYSTDIDTTVRMNWEMWIPDLHVTDDWMRLIHEWIGCMAYKVLK